MQEAPKPTDTEEVFLLPEAEVYWDAFRLLNMQRASTTDGPLPLTAADILAYGHLMAIDQGDFPFLLEFMVDLDQIYLTDSYKRIQEAREKNRNKDKERRGR